MDTMNVVVYARVSSKGKRQTNERQLADLKMYANSRNYSVVNTFEEKISGRMKNREREVLQDCIEFCTDTSNEVGMLLVTEISRLGRSTLEVLKSLDVLHSSRINVYIQNINLETLLPDGRVNPIVSIITTILAEVAGIEWQAITDRLNSGRKLYIEKGGRLGRKPGSFKTEAQKREEYREVISLLKRDYSIRNIAKLTGISISTVQRVKKELL